MRNVASDRSFGPYGSVPMEPDDIEAFSWSLVGGVDENAAKKPLDGPRGLVIPDEAEEAGRGTVPGSARKPVGEDRDRHAAEQNNGMTD